MYLRSIPSRIANRLQWAVAPVDASPTQKRNFLRVQLDAVGVAVAVSAGSFLAVFLTRLGATNFQIGLLTAMPAFVGLFLSIAAGQFLQSRRNIIPWFSTLRLLSISAYALTGIVPFLVSRQHVVLTVLAVWMAVTIPQTMLSIAFSVVMNEVAGPKERYALMSRRWSILGLIKAITVMIVGQILYRTDFPTNYQWAFIILSTGGLISYYFSSRVELPGVELPRPAGPSIRRRLQNYADLIRSEPAFLTFIARRFIFALGATLAAPLFPIYYVRQVGASDAWIGAISAAQTAVTLVGYFFWARQRKKRGSHFVLLWTTGALAIYPALVASTQHVALIALWAGLSGIFQAGLNLVFFDELMKTVPPQYSATFVSVDQSLQNLSALAAPLLGTTLADLVGVQGGILASAAVSLLGFGLFLWRGTPPTRAAVEPPRVDEEVSGSETP